MRHLANVSMAAFPFIYYTKNSFMKIKHLAILGLSIVVAFAACKKKDNTTPVVTPTEGSMKIQFNYVFGSNLLPWELGKTLDHPKTGDKLTFTTFKFYVSNIKLKKNDGTWWEEPNSYHLVCAMCPDQSDIDIKNIPPGDYVEMQYTMGVDSIKNVSGAQTGALDPSYGMFWSWNTGYIMLKAEGSSPNSSDGAFSFHLGGFKGQYNVVTKKATDFAGHTLTIDGSKNRVINLQANPARLWHNSPSVSVTSKIHMPGETAYNMATAFYDNIGFIGME